MSKLLVAAMTLPLAGCLADPAADEWSADASPEVAGDVATQLGEAAASFGLLPEESTPSVGFRATFHSTDRDDPDVSERREGGRVDAIQAAGSRVFIGGYFNRAIRLDGSEVTRSALAAMSTSTLDLVPACNPRLGPARLYGARVRALALSRDGTTLFVAGRFSTVGGAARDNLAAIRVSDCSLRPHFAGWSVNGEIHSLLVDGDSLYVGGDFTSIAGVRRNRVAKLDVANASATVTGWNPGSSRPVKALALDRTRGQVILVLTSAGTVAGEGAAETVALSRASAAFQWKANSGRGGMAAVSDGTTVYVGVRGYGGRVYAYRLSDGAERFWHYCNGDVQALTRYRSYITVGFHDTVVATENNLEVADIFALGLWRMSASGAVDAEWTPYVEIASPTDTRKKVWSLHADSARGRLYAGGDFTRVEGRRQDRFAVFEEPP